MNSPAAEVLVPMTACIAICSTIFGIYYIRGRENMALIERGINPRGTEMPSKSFFSLKYGLLFLGAGLGLFLARMIDMNTREKIPTSDGGFYYEHNPAIYFALIAICGGLGLITSYFIEKKHWNERSKQE